MKKVFGYLAFWFIFAVSIPAFYVYLYKPMVEKKQIEEINKKEQEKLVATTSVIDYSDTVNLGIYSAYYNDLIFNSNEFVDYCLRSKINIKTKHTKFQEIYDGLNNNKLQMAIFPIEAYVNYYGKYEKPPVTIVGIVNEYKGLGKLFCLNDSLSDLSSVNDEYQVIAPSDFAFYLKFINYNFNIKIKNLKFVENHKEVYDLFLKANSKDKTIYLLSEPYSSLASARKDAKVLIDFNNFDNVFLNVIVSTRDFAYQKPDMIAEILKSYFRTNKDFLIKKKPFISFDDNKSPTDEKLLSSVRYINTIENISRFGLSENNLGVHISITLKNLFKIWGTELNENNIGDYYTDGILKFIDKNIGYLQEQMAADNPIKELSEEQWNQLILLGNLNTDSVLFVRGTNKFLDSSLISLEETIQKIENLSKFYILIKGNSLLTGDSTANKEVANARANTVKDYLISRGIPEFRLKVVPMNPTGISEVVFEFGQIPF